ncbi:MAG: DivIVA domain-containing protein [Actinomycetota bacterium]|nr:DivIVA domain-containing protein [Actinomycetota bacterium]
MTDDRRQRVISSIPHLTPDDVANRTFAKGVRGFSESEVRSFLRRVSDELAAMHEREVQLLAVVDDVEEQLRVPRPLDEQQLLDALGEETSRLLRGARESADEIRKKAEDSTALLLRETQSDADRRRAEATETAATRVQEAEAHAAEIIAAAEARATAIDDANERAAEAQRLHAEQESEGIVEAARRQGREMLDEALAARERVLTDLARRRGLLQGQVEELRLGRDHLLDAYRTVKRTFLEATEALAGVEARAAAGKPIPSADTDDIDAVIAAEADSVDLSENATADDAPAAQLADVDSLFARIRAGHDDGDDDSENPTVDIVAVEEAPEPAPEVPADEPAGAAQSSAEAWRELHGSDVAGLISPLLKRAKRAAQDDQNALLDAVRRHKGRPTSAQVLPGEESLVATWVAVLGGSIDDAYRAGRAAAGGDGADSPQDLVTEAATVIVAPVRERISAAIDDSDEAEASGLVERIGARYREWKNQQLENLLGDAIVVAWSRGVYDASAEGSLLHWIPLREGRCADCDDNALEPTARGASFPTGQPFPPAHPGCRCLLAPADILAALPANA